MKKFKVSPPWIVVIAMWMTVALMWIDILSR